MKFIFSSIISIVFAMSASKALSEAPPYSVVSCGNHWFNIEITLDSRSDQAQVEFSGDSRPEVTSSGATYVFTASQSMVVTLDESNDSFIKIDGSDSVHDIYFGTYQPGLSASAINLGLCSVE
jgi:hypothetical protein